MAWNDKEDQEFGARMQQIARQLAEQKKQFNTYPYPPQEQKSREEAARQFMQEATYSFENYRQTGNVDNAYEATSYYSAAVATDPNVKLPASELSELENIALKSSQAPSDKTIAQCLGNVAAKITSVILGVGLGMMTALTVQAAVAVTATILFGPVVGIGSNVPGAVAAGTAGVKVGMESEKIINKKIKSTTELLKKYVEEAYTLATGKNKSPGVRR